MKYQLIIAIILLSVFCTKASVQIVLVVQKNNVEFAKSAVKVEKQLMQLYPHAKIYKPTKSLGIQFSNTYDTLITYFITHSMPFPAGVERFGKLIICLDHFLDFEEISDEDFTDRVLCSADLHKKLEAFKGRKLVVLDGCYSQLAWKNIPKTTWIFSTSTKMTSLGIANIGNLFSDLFIPKKKESSLNLCIRINKQMANSKFYNKKDHPDYYYVPEKSKPDFKNPQISYHHGENFIF